MVLRFIVFEFLAKGIYLRIIARRFEKRAKFPRMATIYLPMKTGPILAAILLSFAVLASWYAAIVPYRTQGDIVRRSGVQTLPDIGAPDERQHANVIRYWTQNGRPPVFQPGTPDFYETYQAHQPPLYYVLAASLGDPTQQGGQRTRYLNVLFGLIGLAGLFFLGKWATDRSEIGLACASVGLIPGHVMLHGAITNDPLLICLCTWMLAALVQACRNGWTWGRVAAVGVLTGLALLTKTSALALLPVLLVGVVWKWHDDRKGENKPAPWMPLAALAIPVAMSAGWFARNQALYGDPIGLRVFGEAFAGTAQARDFIAQFGVFSYWSEWVAWWTARSFVGVFGYMNIFYPDGVYRIALALTFLALVGALAHARRNESLPKPSSLLAGTFFLVVLALHVRFNMTYFQGQARYLLPALGPIALGLAWGAVGWFHKRPMGAAATLAVIGIALNVFALMVVIPEWFSRIQLTPNP